MRTITYGVSTTSKAHITAARAASWREAAGEQGWPLLISGSGQAASGEAAPSGESPVAFPLAPAPPWCHPRCDSGFRQRTQAVLLPEAESGLNLPSNRAAVCSAVRPFQWPCARGLTGAVSVATATFPRAPAPPSSVLTGGWAGSVMTLGHKCYKLYSSFRAEAGTPVT